MAVFCVVAPCSLVKLYQRFRGPYLSLDTIWSATRKTAIFGVAAKKPQILITFVWLLISREMGESDLIQFSEDLENDYDENRN